MHDHPKVGFLVLVGARVNTKAEVIDHGSTNLFMCLKLYRMACSISKDLLQFSSYEPPKSIAVYCIQDSCCKVFGTNKRISRWIQQDLSVGVQREPQSRPTGGFGDF